MVPNNLLDIMIIFISIPFITMIVVTIVYTMVYIVDYYLPRVVTELREKLRK